MTAHRMPGGGVGDTSNKGEYLMTKAILLAAAATIVSATAAQAQVTFIADQASFSAAGTIAQNTNFDTQTSGWAYPGNSFTVGALTFASGENLIGGVDSYGLLRPLLTDNFLGGTTVSVDGAYNLFGFNAGNFFSSTGSSAITVNTNLGSYEFSPTVTYGGTALTFLGFKAGAGETISSVRFYSTAALGGTDFQIGNVAGVPEPATWALMILGFGAVGGAMRRRQSTKATLRFA